jgi:hypothetical protein
MGFFDDLFGASESKTSSTSSIPKWMEAAGQNNYKFAQSIASKPYTPYSGGARIAPMSVDQTKAQQLLRDFKPVGGDSGTGMGTPRVIDNIGRADGSGPAGTTQDYMDPYLDNVLDRTQNRIREATDMARQWQSNASSHGEGAFGDARHGIADSLIEEKGIQQMGDTSAAAYSAAYNDAMGRKQGDIDNLFRGREADRGDQDAYMKYIDSLYRSGSNTQSQQQQNMTLKYQDFLRQLGYPQEQLDILTRALTGTPHNTTTTTSEPGPSTASTILGGLSSILSLF